MRGLRSLTPQRRSAAGIVKFDQECNHIFPPGEAARERAIKYRPDIDGLRALAVISVVSYHCAPGWVKSGYIGVDVFFVISGYLIGALVYKEICAGSFSIAEFYKRRAKRILPALFAVLLFCYVVALLMPVSA